MIYLYYNNFFFNNLFEFKNLILLSICGISFNFYQYFVLYLKKKHKNV